MTLIKKLIILQRIKIRLMQTSEKRLKSVSKSNYVAN